MEDKTQRLLRYLNDAYASEKGGVMALKDLALVADGEAKAIIEEHLAVTEWQAERLRDRILALGGDKSEPKALLNSMLAKGSSLANLMHDHEDKLTQDLIKAYSLEHFEIGMYLSLYTYAMGIGDTDTAMLADTILAEEREAANRIEPLITQAAAAAVNKAHVEMESGNGNGKSFGVPAAALILPGAALAAWGIARMYSHYKEGRADTSSMLDELNAPDTIDVCEPVLVAITTETDYLPERAGVTQFDRESIEG